MSAYTKVQLRCAVICYLAVFVPTEIEKRKLPYIFFC